MMHICAHIACIIIIIVLGINGVLLKCQHSAPSCPEGCTHYMGSVVPLSCIVFSSDTRTCALPITHKDEALIKFKSFFYFEHKDTPVAEAEQVSMYIYYSCT